ncbi:MAG: Flp family type IVb pilin [Firmicutes bacterium]|nr:Flp family type IVb pilin [Bacillota bacterium]
MTVLWKRLLPEEGAQGMAEYGLILAFVALAVTMALTGLGSSIESSLVKTANGFK